MQNPDFIEICTLCCCSAAAGTAVIRQPFFLILSAFLLYLSIPCMFTAGASGTASDNLDPRTNYYACVICSYRLLRLLINNKQPTGSDTQLASWGKCPVGEMGGIYHRVEIGAHRSSNTGSQKVRNLASIFDPSSLDVPRSYTVEILLVDTAVSATICADN